MWIPLWWLLACRAALPENDATPLPLAAPQRVVLIFVDTLRPDHLGLYGYDRETSAALDAWASNAVIFEQARSVAPWTLPSVRAVLSGRQPEQYDVANTLQGILGQQGWATAMFGENVYLSEAYGMNAGFQTHQIEFPAPARMHVDRALSWMEAHKSQPEFLLVNFMEPHLPYGDADESAAPFSAGEQPASLPAKLAARHTVPVGDWTPDELGWLKDRYDEEIAGMHAELSRLFAALRDDDIVVYFSDHGEEFGDHGGFEHGHTTYEELLHVPLVVKAPGLAARRVSAPVSLIDVAPTVLELLGSAANPTGHRSDGATPDQQAGISLVGLAKGEPEVRARALGFGRTLYGPEQWGVVQTGMKYRTTEGTESLVDLRADPSEATNLWAENPADVAEWRRTLGLSLGRKVSPGYRLILQLPTAFPGDLVATLRLTDGVHAAWSKESPMVSPWTRTSVQNGLATVTWTAGARGSFEAFVDPNMPDDATLELCVSLPPGVPVCAAAAFSGEPAAGNRKAPIIRIQLDGGGSLTLKYSINAVPSLTQKPEGLPDLAVEKALQTLGYLPPDN